MQNQQKTANLADDNSPPENFAFTIPIRVYYEDTDAGGVVYHSNYINYFERARTEWLRSLGFEQDNLVSEHQSIFVVRSLDCEYLRPALFNDELFVTVEIREIGKTIVVFKQHVVRKAKNDKESKHGEHVILAKGNVSVVVIDSIKLKPKRLPKFLLEKINKENVK